MPDTLTDEQIMALIPEAGETNWDKPLRQVFWELLKRIKKADGRIAALEKRPHEPRYGDLH